MPISTVESFFHILESYGILRSTLSFLPFNFVGVQHQESSCTSADSKPFSKKANWKSRFWRKRLFLSGIKMGIGVFLLAQRSI
jgi:hypothetical protein